MLRPEWGEEGGGDKKREIFKHDALLLFSFIFSLHIFILVGMSKHSSRRFGVRISIQQRQHDEDKLKRSLHIISVRGSNNIMY